MLLKGPDEWKKERILVLVKTYPNLSKKYEETVCCAGITLKGIWVRLYPIRYRKLPIEKHFKKWQIIEADIKTAKEKLMRKESHKIKEDSIKIIKTLIPQGSKTQRNNVWKERNKMLLPLLNKSLEELKASNDKTSLGLIKPKQVDFYRTPLDECREWEKDLIKGTQRTLLELGRKEYKSPLDKIPFKFSYRFYCDAPGCKGHDLMCEDWELIESYRSWKQKYKTDELLWQKFKEKYLDWMLKRDLYFIVGTESRFNKWLIIGLYYPPKGL